MDDRNEEWSDIKELKAELAGMTEDRNAVTRQRNEALRRVDEYIALDAGMGATLLKAQSRIRELEAADRIAALEAALLQYGYHNETCDFLQDTLACTCGFESLRAALAPAQDDAAKGGA